MTSKATIGGRGEDDGCSIRTGRLENMCPDQGFSRIGLKDARGKVGGRTAAGEPCSFP